MPPLPDADPSLCSAGSIVKFMRFPRTFVRIDLVAFDRQRWGEREAKNKRRDREKGKSNEVRAKLQLQGEQIKTHFISGVAKLSIGLQE